jgi:hypothetical protein
MKRSSYLKHDEVIELGKRGLTIWGYSTKGRFVCRVEINAAGLTLYSGTKGRKRIANASWENLVKKLSKPKVNRRKKRG